MFESLLILFILVLAIFAHKLYMKVKTIEQETKAIYTKQLDFYKIKVDVLEQSRVDTTKVVSKEFFEQQIQEKETKIKFYVDSFNELQENYSKLLSQKKSSEVRTGLIGENLMPFLDNFPYNPKNCKALFQPIDLIHFGEEQINFIELKTGNSQLSKKQKRIKKQIESGQIEFNVIRLDEEGLKED